MVITSKLGKNGRLGNQLWQIAAILGYSRRYLSSMPPIIPPWEYLSYFPNMRELSGPHRLQGEIPTVFNVYQEPHFHYADIPEFKHVDLHGYFQSEKYFSNWKSGIEYFFKPDTEFMLSLIDKHIDILDGITCSVHIRRGDYTDNSGHEVHDVCKNTYYRAAMEYVLSKTHVDRILIFSDDIAWCKENIGDHPKVKQVFIEDQKDVADLFLMSLCTHNIICNSSFSWWASYLNSNAAKIVVAPDHWFASPDYANDKDVYADFMIKVKA